MTHSDTHLYTLSEAVELLRVSRGSVYRLIRSGQLEVVKIGGRTLVRDAELHRLIEAGRRRTTTAEPGADDLT